MGQVNIKIHSKIIGPQQLLRKGPIQVGLHFYPFKQFSSFQFDQEAQIANIKLDKPYSDSLKIQTNIYSQLQKAVFQKTFDIRFEHVLFDTFNFDKAFHLGRDSQTPIVLIQRKFRQYDSQLYKNILYEKHIYQTVNTFQCQNLIQMKDSFAINSKMEEQLPLSYFFIFENLQTNLTEIIRYRRQNNSEWFITEFQKLCWDLVKALDQLHQNNITHNDIRPCNIFYSVQAQSYVLGEFSNALKTDPAGNFLNVRTRQHPSFAINQKQLKTQALRLAFINHKRADIYSLGMTLLCAFYMVQPVQRKLAAPINRKMEQEYDIMQIIRKMVYKSQKIINISEIKEDLANCNKNAGISYLIDSIKFRYKPKAKHLPMIFQAFASAYKRLGLWQEWRDSSYRAYQTSEGFLSLTQDAQYLKQLARVQKIMQNYQEADKLGQKSAGLFYKIGIQYQKQTNLNQALKALNNGIKALKYCANQNKIVLVKIMQSLSLLHAQKNQYKESIACLSESKRILNRTFSDSILDYYEIRTQQARICQIHHNYEESQKILKQLLKKSKNTKDSYRQIEFLKGLGQNSIKKVENSNNPQNESNQEMEISSPLKRSSCSFKLYAFESQQIDGLQINGFSEDKFHQAEQFFLSALSQISRKLLQLKSSKLHRRRSRLEKDADHYESHDLDFQYLQIQNLRILNFLGVIKYKLGSIERSEDYFYKVLAQLDKIFQVMQASQNPKHSNQLKKISLSSIKLQHDNNQSVISDSNSRISDFSTKNLKNTPLITGQINEEQNRKIIRHSKYVQTQPKRVVNKGDLMKIKADVQCSIALCKQHSGEFKEMLAFYNKSLTSYKNYYGQYHNKRCGIIIGCMAVGYQKVNQHNKAISCIELATEILKDILPENSPDLKHFQKIKVGIIQEQSVGYKKVQDRSNQELAQNLMGRILSQSIVLKKSQSRPKISYKGPYEGTQKLFQQSNISNSANYGLNLGGIKQQNEGQNALELEQCESQKINQSQSSSLRQIQLPLKVSYYNSANLLQLRSDQWQQ